MDRSGHPGYCTVRENRQCVEVRTPVTLGKAAPQSARVPCSRVSIPDLSLGGAPSTAGRARLAVRGPELTAVRMGGLLCEWSRTAALA